MNRCIPRSSQPSVRSSTSPAEPAKEVGLCGEMASDPMATLLLLGMGLDQFSLSPMFIPVVRKLIRDTNYQTARHIAHDVMQMATVQEIKGYLFERYRDLGLVHILEMYR